MTCVRRFAIGLGLCSLAACASSGGRAQSNAPTAGPAALTHAPLAEPALEAIVLGTAQDGGLPHVGCRRAPCERARREPAFARSVVSLALVDRVARRRFLVEATPDLPRQLDRLDALAPPWPVDTTGAPGASPRPNPVDGVLITHAHIGHYAGLVHFGREVASTRGLPLYGSARLLGFLQQSGPWRLLFELGQVEPRPLAMDERTPLTAQLSVTALRVPHRDEFSDTVAFVISGPNRTLLFVPDIDRWAAWERRIEDVVAGVDVALIDATFHSAGELPGRAESEVPHPLVTDSMRRLAAQAQKVIFIHLNHTNPLCDPESAESRAARQAGFRIAEEGMRIVL